MSNPRLPAELLDDVVDLLHDAPHALRNCCLVSKSWIPRTRRHLFADVTFHTVESLELWKKIFPDPSTSPAHYTKTLSVGCPHAATAADAQAGGWISTFSNVLRLNVDRLHGDGSAASLLLFRGFSPVLKSLDAHFAPLPPSQIFDFILSFPLLEDLAATARDGSIGEDDDSDELSPAVRPSNLPRFTGSLELPGTGIKFITRRFLSLPGGIHFRKLILRWFKAEDVSLTMALVEGCSHTLEFLDIGYVPRFEFKSASFNLSKATKLRHAVFRLESLKVEWVTVILQAITPKHQDLQHISIYMHGYMLPPICPGFKARLIVGERVFEQWLDLDRLLVQFWESRSIRPRFVCGQMGEYEQSVKRSIGCLLPVAAGGGMFDVVE